MNTERIARLEHLLNRELSAEEKERLRRIRDVLQLSDQDAVWDLLMAMEYQKAYYEDLPHKITAASTEVLRQISEAAEAEARRAHGKLAESVAEQAKKLSLRVNMETLLPMGLCALVCLLAYGSLAMWAGFRIGSGQADAPIRVLWMPSGALMGGIALAGGIFLGVHAARVFAEGRTGWKKKALVAVAMLIAGGALTVLGII